MIVAALLAFVRAAPLLLSSHLPRPQRLPRDEGPDRLAKIASAARREGSLTLYTTIAEKDLATLVGPFEAKYGIKVTVWRAGTDKVLQRTVAEAAAGRHEWTSMHFGSPEMEALSREHILQPVSSPVHDDLLPGSVPAHREWAATLLSVWVQAYNTTLVSKESLPKTYRDLLDPEVEAASSASRRKTRTGSRPSWMSWAVGETGLDVLPTAGSGNGISVRLGHTLLTNMVISGEVPLALTVYNYMPEQAKKKGAPIDWFALEPAIARSNAVGVARRAPHPNAALLFYEYLLGEEAQQSFVSMDYVPSNSKVASPLNGVTILQTDPVRTLDETEAWTRLFDDTVLSRTGR